MGTAAAAVWFAAALALAQTPPGVPLEPWRGAVAALVVLVACGVVRALLGRSSRGWLTCAALAGAGLLGWMWWPSPGRLLWILLGLFGAWVALWDQPVAPPEVERPRRATAALAATIAGWLGIWVLGADGPLAAGALTGACAATGLLALRAVVTPRRRLLAVAGGVAGAAAFVPGPQAAGAWSWPALVLLASALWGTGSREAVRAAAVDSWWAVALDPAKLVVSTFGLGGALGATLLASPLATESGRSIGLMDAIFTAFSAICVTGLVVVDTPTVFGPFGEAVILGLIQIGGLGIMTLSTAAFVLLGRRMSLRHEATAALLLNASDRRHLAGVLRRILIVTFSFELAGALVLAVLFAVTGDAPATAAWRGAFTAVSAFCNAGFALQTDSLMPYQQDAAILWTVAVLIVAGGLGPAVLAELSRGTRSLQTRLVLTTSAVLLFGGFLLILAFEWSQTLGDLNAFDTVTNAFFQSATLRTAGFNSVDLGLVQPATYTIMLCAMFVGGSPGSTAGGVKTTTIATLVLLVRSAFHPAHEVAAFGRELGMRTVRRAAAVSFLGVLFVIVVLVSLQLTQAMRLEVALFEAVSALATVGLSIGGTSELDAVGKSIVTVAMFAGRVGPLTLLLFLARRSAGAVAPARRFARADIDIG